ncbi:MAG: BamA/TamA family outer membrane protein [Bacteroidaceae bacterium]|nr:BamA/TamA family outer membrane protein [Bacteroidaceae bacterium]
MRKTVTYLIMATLLASCSTTRHIPDGEQLYTGIKKIEIDGEKKYAASSTGQQAMEEVVAALDRAPNGAIAGSSTYRGLPVGLWWYNAFYNSKGRIGRWFFETFGDAPVLMSDVNPELRAQVANNILKYYGYFNGSVTENIITDKKNSKKAKVIYNITLHKPYLYDSIQYRGFTGKADSLIKATKAERLIRKGEQFSATAINSERERINTLLRNNGYYYYQPTFTRILADTINTPGYAQMRIEPQAGLAARNNRPYTIGNINIHILRNNTAQYAGSKNDTIRRSRFSYIYNGEKPPVRPGTMLRNIYMRPGELYSQEAQQKTVSRLSQINIFGNSNITFTPRGESDTLDLNIMAQLDKPYDFTFEMNVTSKSNNQIGPGSIISLSRKNLFRGGETLTMSLKGSYEWQTKDEGITDKDLLNSWEMGADVSLTFPRLFLPFFQRRLMRIPSSTSLRVYVNRLNRSGFFRMIHLGGDLSYKIYTKSTTTHTITPLRLTFDLLRDTSEKFDEIVANNRSLQNSFRDQFIPAMQYTFVYDNAKTRHRNKSYFEGSITAAGNITSLAFCAFGKGWNQKDKHLFENPYAQFVKLTAELRQLYRIDRNNFIATRIMAGILHSYGNSEYAPYSEQFYIGGANSLRAFTVRTVGPGSFHPATETRYSYLDETGTLKLEANIEYRFRIISELHGAIFVDAGNIWLTKKDESRPGGEITMKDFAKDIALNTGFGVRYDLDFLVLRLDFGLGLHAPYKTDKRGYFNLSPFGNGFAWHFAIGYPF